MRSSPMLPHYQENHEDLEAVARSIQERYGRRLVDYDEEMTDVEQALLPSVRDPKLWMVKCVFSGLQRSTQYIGQKITLVPIREMTDVLSVDSEAIDLARDTLVRMKTGTYKGDLAKWMLTVKLIPRIDLQALANKLEGREVVKKKAFVPPPHFMNVDEARELHIHVEHRCNAYGERFDAIGGIMFKDGFLYKTVSIKSISTQNIKSTFDELENFHKPGKSGDGDVASLSTLFANRKKGHFMKGDAVIIVKGDLKNLKGPRPEIKGLPKCLSVNEKELSKYFEPRNHVKVVSGAQEGATGMVVKVQQHVLILISDTTKEHALKGIPDRPEVVVVKLREIKCKIEKKGKQGPVEHIYRGILFVFDHQHLENAGFICANA
ncbi:putative transcription elongation factor SPT5-like 1 [Spatholobus suberectus]|nr:putative transcription elongation factor SPT5-like 1 [Spatholobus suberectus]